MPYANFKKVNKQATMLFRDQKLFFNRNILFDLDSADVGFSSAIQCRYDRTYSVLFGSRD